MPRLIHEYPLWAERTIRAIRISSYGFAALTGAAAIFITPTSLKAEQYVIVGSMLVFGGICLLASVTKRYVLEWVSLFFLTAGISVYVSAVWISAISNPKVIAGASIFTVLVLLMVIRIIDLTVYWMKNVETAKLQEDMSRGD